MSLSARNRSWHSRQSIKGSEKPARWPEATHMDQIVNLCKGRGFIFAGSEIYGGLANTWDYGPLGVELKNNVKKAWWKKKAANGCAVAPVQAPSQSLAPHFLLSVVPPEFLPLPQTLAQHDSLVRPEPK